MASAWTATADGVRLSLRVTPNAGRDLIEGLETRADGSVVLRVRVRAVPDRGKANEAVTALLARALGRPKSAVRLVAGETSRSKTLAIAGDPVDLAAALASLAG